MLANAKIVLRNKQIMYLYFPTVDKMCEWMKRNYGKYKYVETNFIEPWNINERTDMLCQPITTKN